MLVSGRHLFKIYLEDGCIEVWLITNSFSLPDVLGSAKGWAASLLFHSKLRDQFKVFAAREDTFSLGVCNGCQLMSLLGWIGMKPLGQFKHLHFSLK